MPMRSVVFWPGPAYTVEDTGAPSLDPIVLSFHINKTLNTYCNISFDTRLGLRDIL